MPFTIRGTPVSIGWIIALLVLVFCAIVWFYGVTPLILLGLVAALAVAFLIG